MRNIKIVVEKHEDGYVAYPLGLKGVVVGEGDSYKGSTLRTICNQAGISRDEFLQVL